MSPTACAIEWFHGFQKQNGSGKKSRVSEFDVVFVWTTQSASIRHFSGYRVCEVNKQATAEVMTMRKKKNLKLLQVKRKERKEITVGENDDYDSLLKFVP